MKDPAPEAAQAGVAARTHVLQNRLYRRTWISSLSSNLGMHILVATAAWSMMEITRDPERVALVQTAFLLPALAFGFLSGPVVDTFQKRRIVLTAGAVMAAVSLAAWASDRSGAMQPFLIYAACFVMGSSQAFMMPALQTAVRQFLPRSQFPQAITLNSISFNAGRSVGPALGGALIAAIGASAGFAAPFFATLPIIFTALSWPAEVTQRAYRERLPDAIESGVRYILNSPPILNCQFRGLMVSSCTSVMAALAPFVAADMLNAGPSAYGGLLGAYGVGSVAGALLIDRARRSFAAETILRSLMVAGAAGCAIVSASSAAPLSMAGYFVVGFAHMGSITSLNIIGQLHSAQWAAARVFSTFFSFSAGGLAVSSVLWGVLAGQTNTATAMLAATGAFCLMFFVSRFAPVAFPAGNANEPVDPMPLRWPSETLAAGDGPIVVDLRFTIDPSDQAAFRRNIARLMRSHARIGFRRWALTRSVERASEWNVRYTVKTWADYLNHRTRMTSEDRDIIETLRGLHRGPVPIPASISIAVRPAMEARLRAQPPALSQNEEKE